MKPSLPGFLAILTSAVLVASSLAGESSAELSLEDRMKAQRAIEEVLWRHRLWPESNARAKPSLAQVLPEAVLRARALEGLKKTTALERFWGAQLSGALIQAEINRMVSHSHSREVLAELFAALHNEPLLVAEVLVRPIVADRVLRERLQRDGGEPEKKGPGMQARVGEGGFDAWWSSVADSLPTVVAPQSYGYVLPDAPVDSCVNDTWSPVAVDVPAGRENHTAVWTGTEMIVWGGAMENGGYYGAGAKYDPALDLWTPIRADSTAPGGRWQHVAVWTGTQMMIWGGQGDSATDLNSGGLYDPLTDTWRSTKVDANTPGGFLHGTAVWTGREVIVFGSTGGGRYDPASDAWLPMASGVVHRSQHTAVWTGNEMIVWGGVGVPNLNSGDRYNPTTNSWTPIPVVASTPAGRDLHTAVWTGKEMIIWGGYGISGPLNDGGSFDPTTNVWTPTRIDSRTPQARYLHTAVWTGHDMFIWGGSPFLGPKFSSGGLYDPRRDSWSVTLNDATTPTGREGHTAVWTGSEVIVWGGYPAASMHTGGRYNPGTDTWTPTSFQTLGPRGRMDHTAVWTGSEMIVWGGRDLSSRTQSGGRYNPATDTWTSTKIEGATASARSGHTAVWTGTEMIVWGGTSDTAPGYATGGGRYNPLTDSWQTVRADASAPVPRDSHTAVWTGREMIVWGGSNPSTAASYTGGRYDPATDTWRATRADGTQPFYRSQHTAVWTGREMIVWGGYGPVGDGYLNTGGRYDPLTDLWTPTSLAPAGRRHHTAIWTGREMILWGGYDAAGLLRSGLRYDPALDSWSATRMDSSTPQAMADHKTVWTGHDMIVWYWRGGRYDPLTDTWSTTRFDGSTPPPHIGMSAVWNGNEMIEWGGGPSNSGGRYCACSGGARLYFQDSDDDGRGDASVSIPSCSPPFGYTETTGDCSDSDGTSWSTPGEVDRLDFAQDASMTWTVPSDPGGTATEVLYDLIRSNVARDFVGPATCVTTNTSATTMIDSTLPPTGAAFYYLVRAGNGCPLEGPLGSDSSGVPRLGRTCP